MEIRKPHFVCLKGRALLLTCARMLTDDRYRASCVCVCGLRCMVAIVLFKYMIDVIDREVELTHLQNVQVAGRTIFGALPQDVSRSGHKTETRVVRFGVAVSDLGLADILDFARLV